MLLIGPSDQLVDYYPSMGNTKVIYSLQLPYVLVALCLGACSTTNVDEDIPESIETTNGEAQYAVATRQDRIGRIVVPVSINGQGVFRLMLDTGATHSVLTSTAAARLGMNVSEAPVSMVQGVVGRVAAPVVMVERLQAGSLKLQHLQMAVMDGVVVSGLDGILGIGSLNNMTLTADFINDRVHIRKSAGHHANELDTVIKFEVISKHLIVVNAMAGRVPVRAVIDTGGSRTLGNLALLKAIVRQHNDRASIQLDITDVTETSKNGSALFLPSILLGDIEIGNSTIACADFDVFHSWHLEIRPALLIGMDVLGQLGEVSIDYRRKELRLRRRLPDEP